MNKINLLFLLLIIQISAFSQTLRVIESNDNSIKLDISFADEYQVKDTIINNIKFQKIKGKQLILRKAGEPGIPCYNFNIGIPHDSKITYQILTDQIEKSDNKFILPFREKELSETITNELIFDKGIYNSNQLYPLSTVQINQPFFFRFAKLNTITINPFQFNPITKELLFHKNLTIQIDYNSLKNVNKIYQPVSDKLSNEYVKTNTVNSKVAQNWIIRENQNTILKTSESKDWYNPNKKYFKIFLKDKGVYRITYQQLRNAGLTLDEIESFKLELYNNGEKIPIEIFDGGDDLFNENDYFQFIGYPPKPTPHSKLNIYNNSNVYWFSYQSDEGGFYYASKDGFPTIWDTTVQSSFHIIHYEKDSIYERLGLAPDGNCDHWFWGKASGRDNLSQEVFTYPFPIPKNLDEKYESYKLRINFHGMTNNNNINPDHKVHIFLTSQPVGEITWDGQNAAQYESILNRNNVSLFSSGNNLQVVAKGDITPDIFGSTSDEVRVNWFEIEYLREHRADSNYFDFKSSPNLNGNIRLDVFRWKSNSMNIYIPQKGIVIKNPWITNNEYQEVLFIDSIKEQTEYFCFSNDFFRTPDSITTSNSSDLHSTSNGADYIIITHSKFRSAAERLANFRSNHLNGFSSPRVKIVDIEEIYNEFSYGLLDPYAVQNFVKYAFENWTQPSPSYICLIGDMSWDYRGLLSSSRKNYIPSIPYQQITYGEAVSDNMFAAVSGEDVIPDLAIGRLSCETLEEANTLIDKIINYPEDNSKVWKQIALLIGAGESLNDENYFGFNNASLFLENSYLKPNGYASQKIFRYPGKPELVQFQGDRPEIRDALNKGCVITNFYGHGGGYQWDFVFLNDDIYLLQNNGRLPMVFSITCYTAHFDNQDVFGEQFNKVPNKGCIGFWGNTGLTIWNFAVEMNNKLFEQIFNKQHFIVGDAMLFTKSNYTNISQYQKDHIALLTLLGDPALELALPNKPDFAVSTSSISVSPNYPIVNEQTSIKININNLGRIFPDDSVTVQLFASFPDTTFQVGSKKLGSFGEIDSVLFNWIPSKSGLVTLKVEVNVANEIDESDLSDNSASNSIFIYNLSEPNIIKPFNGYNTSSDKIYFLFADIGYYISKSLIYYIEIDTSLTFNNPIFKSLEIIPLEGIVEWLSPQLQNGNYFWRARMLDGNQYSKWTATQTFSISPESKEGYSISENQLNLFTLDNIIYSENSKALQLNTSILPPKPSNQKFISDIMVVLPDAINGISAITTDGIYIYFGSIAYYNGPSKIYKLGTGHNNTDEGRYYGPVSDRLVNIVHQIFYHSDGFIYIADGKAYSLLRMDPKTGDTLRISVPDGLLNDADAKVRDGGYYLSSDGQFVYNLAYKDSLGNYKYTVRIFDPSQNWQKVKDITLTGESYYLGFCSFFVAQGYIYPYENYWSGWLRRIDLSSGEFKDEWVSYLPFQGYYSWCYDWTNDVVYASVFRSGFTPKISKFAGTYKQASGSIITQEVGPAVDWKKLNYVMETSGTSGYFNSALQGLNTSSRNWETIKSNIPNELNLDTINVYKYSKLRLNINLVDSSFGSTDPLKLKSLNIQYTNLPEIILTKNNLIISPDSVLQGFPTKIKFKVKNYGYSTSENLKLDFFIDNSDSSFYTKDISLPQDSVIEFSYPLSTNNYVLNHKIKVKAETPKADMFTFNNLTEKDFYIVRDSIRPVFSIKFDGIEILNGDIVSSKPKVIISLVDNSPLPLNDTSRFFIFHNNEQIFFGRDSLKFSYSEYPNSQATVEWNPVLKNGKHTLEILAKDASGNFFDTTSYSISFLVSDKNDIFEIYNFPNPFKDETYFTFKITGEELPDAFQIKIFTVAGRLVRDISVPTSDLHFGFNKIYWNGRDQDENILANGIYFYKIILRNKNISKTIIQKLAKVK